MTNRDEIGAADATALEEKRFATLQARAALYGNFTLSKLADGSFIAVRHGRCRELATLDAIDDW
ncbi:MAG: hypothetical protein ABI583_03925, partial [Betaproteobacteria bacterium]